MINYFLCITFFLPKYVSSHGLKTFMFCYVWWKYFTGFPLDLENLENLEKLEYTWKTWKYHGILKNLINIMEKWHETWKNLVATKNSPWIPFKEYTIH